MTLTIPHVIHDFIEKIRIHNVWQRIIIPRLIAGMLLWQGEINFSTLAKAILTENRNRSSIQRFFSRERFRSRDIYTVASNFMIEQEQKAEYKRIWVVIIDGTSNKRGGFTKIENAVQYRKKSKGKKGSSTKAHTFIMGILITEKGTRIPLPRRTWYTRSYCRKHKRKYISMVKLMGLMIEKLNVPENVQVIILADEYFEGKEIKDVCDRNSYIYICPVDSRRRFGNGTKREGSTLYKHGKWIARNGLETILLIPGKEETVSYRRYTCEKEMKNKRTYRATSELRNVAGLGLVRVVYSWKTPVYDPRRDDSRQSYKVLVTNGVELKTRQIIEYYELRWQIEIFFREIKSSIGMCHYRGTSFEAFEKYIDMILLSFLFLEYLRKCLLEKTRSKAKRKEIGKARTTEMIYRLSLIALEDDMAYIAEAARIKGGIGKLLKTIKGNLKIAA
ncbi:MAG: hypothetical protein A2Y62_18145 [Candidatus Fischerbacteria bacterium RBG_13_37_8]|uniref:Transposase IS4-like domain-containing protein n=1 Tax=Candidatus Fischerbacteria bacterium RBG_13_37_8 TaxID=1817863 RepID=A0A1F5V6R3_9BACT|nr:MAG: hypothetical protein A2Y62_18145 [Candidatus Fischerbacteria bacterium RBG_13_37_8]